RRCAGTGAPPSCSSSCVALPDARLLIDARRAILIGGLRHRARLAAGDGPWLGGNHVRLRGALAQGGRWVAGARRRRGPDAHGGLLGGGVRGWPLEAHARHLSLGGELDGRLGALAGLAGLLARLRAEDALRHLAELRGLQVRGDVAVEAEAARAPLFADDHHDRVRLLGDAEGGPVPRAEALIDDAPLGHGEEHARLGDAQIADDHRAVVELVAGLGREQGDQQLPRDLRVDVVALVVAHELVEVRVLFEGDDGADAVARQLAGGLDDLVDDPRLLSARQTAEPGPAAHALQRAPDVTLEDDDDDEQDAL